MHSASKREIIVCNHCHYRFSAEEDMSDRRCPYCGERALTKSPSAQALIEGTDD